MTGFRLQWYHIAAWLVAVVLLLLFVVSPPVSAATCTWSSGSVSGSYFGSVCSGFNNSGHSSGFSLSASETCLDPFVTTSRYSFCSQSYPYYYDVVQVQTGIGVFVRNPSYDSPVTPTPTPEPKYCANYCGHRFQYPTPPGNLAITCYFSAGGCTVCENVLHLMSEAETYWPCESQDINATLTQTPVPTYTYPTATVTPTATSTMLPSVTYAPVKIGTIPTMADFKNTSGLDTELLKIYIYSKLGINLTSPYTDWCDSIANSVLSLIRAGFYIPDWPITTVTDMMESVNQILDTVITYFSSAVNVLLYFSTHAMNSLPDGIKWLMVYGCICDLAVLILRGET